MTAFLSFTAGQIFLCFATLLLAPAPAAAKEPQARLEALKQDRRQVLEDLIGPIENCVQRQDQNFAAFHGCGDWHSAVHGTWALVKYTQWTRDRRYAALIDQNLSPANLKREYELLKSSPAFEMPYGRAWFLRLAVDDKKTFGTGRLDALAKLAADSLVRHYAQTPPDPMSREYDSAAWALLNLYDYGRAAGNGLITAFAENHIKEFFAALADVPCPAKNEESQWPDFLPPCTGRALLVSRVRSGPDMAEWLKRFWGPKPSLRPVSRPRTPHHHGMNFSRAWGFWGLYKATNDPHYLKLYLDHFELQYKNRDWWAGDYRDVGHWVAQFGVFAAAPLFEE